MPQPAALARTDEPSIHDVIDLAGARDRAPTKLVFSQRAKCWWSRTGSNRRPEACKATALPTELRPRSSLQRAVVGPDRFELSTPRLSSVCSNQLSYGPSPAAVRALDTHSATGLANSHASRGSRRIRVLRRRETKTATNRKYPCRP